MTRIFISYRRADSGFAADRVHEAALDYVKDPKDVFMDIDGIPPGVDFVDHINEKVGQCDVLFALIGREWLDTRDAETGSRRLDDPKDFVRAEIASALERGIPVVPVLLGETAMPREEDLPDNLKSLARRNGIRVGRKSFSHDMSQLMAGLGISPVKQGKRKSGGSLLSTLLLVVVLAGALGLGAYAWQSGWLPVGAPDDPDPAPEASEPVGESRSRRLGITVLQAGEVVPLMFQDELAMADEHLEVALAGQPFQLQFPASHWKSVADEWPPIKLVFSEDPALFDTLVRNETSESLSPFFAFCAYAIYEFGSADLLSTRMGEGPEGIPCGHNTFGVQQTTSVTATSRTITINTVTHPDDESETNLIAPGKTLYMIAYLSEARDWETSMEHAITYGEVDFFTFEFR